MRRSIGVNPGPPLNALQPGVAMVFDFKHLRYAMAAAEYRSFRRAAEALRLKQSTLSRQIRRMEQRLGVLLFERSSTGARPTAAGFAFLRTARRIVEDVDAMTNQARAAGRGEAGRLTIGVQTSLSTGNLRGTLIDYTQRFPFVRIRAIEGARERLLAGLKNELIDIAIVTGNPAPSMSGTMALWSERMIVALAETHRLAANENLYWTDLKGETLLLARCDSVPDVLDLLATKLTSPDSRPVVVQHDVSRDTIVGLVVAGLGVSLVCETYVGATYAGLVYREARDGNGPSRVSYAALWQKDNDNPALARFLKLLEERYPTLPPSK